MKIKMTTSMAGTSFSLSAGEVTDRFETREAQRLIEAGYAVPVAEPKAERAKRQAKARKPVVETR